MPRDPCFASIYSMKGTGKTTDALAASSESTVWIAAPGALASAEAVWGFEQPQAHDLETFDEIRLFAQKVNGPTTMIVVDDASLVADRTVNKLGNGGAKASYDVWARVLHSAISLRDALRRKAMHVVFTCHPAVAEVKNGVRLLGGPAFPGQVRSKLPPAFDLLVRGEQRGTPGIGWGMVYRTTLHPDWLQSSRYNTPDPAPMNLREILHAAGFKLPRRRGLEWQETIAAAIAGKLADPALFADVDKVKAVLLFARDHALAKFTKDLRHAEWAMRDGYDRAVLHHGRKSSHANLWGF